MQSELALEKKLIWTKLEDNIFVTQFAATFPGDSSARIYVKRFDALKSNKHHRTVFLLHDLGQYHGRFQAMIDWYRQNHPEISFVAMDFRGHGLSSGTRGHFEKFDYLVNDFLYLLNQIEKSGAQSGKLNDKWILLGHGLGGLVALDLLNRFQESVEDRIDGLILSNFVLHFDSSFLNFEERLLSEGSGIRKLLAHSRPMRLKSSSEFLSDAHDILEYEQDPLIIHRPTFRSIRETQKKISNIYQDSYFLGKPMLILNSESDTVAKSSNIDHFARGIKKDLLTEKKYSLMKHDLYNERDKEIIFQDIMDWIKKYEK